MRSSVLFVVFFAALLQYSFSQTNSQPRRIRRAVDKETILFLFQNRIYKSLTEKLEEIQLAFEQDFTEESNVVKAYDVFAKTDPLYESLFNEWIAAYPAVSSPYAARAEYYCKCAFSSRGTGWAKNTSEKQFAEMERYFALAMEDIKKALGINPKIDVCYGMLINMGMATGDDALKLNSLKESLKNNPYGYDARSIYLFSLTPRWGGSYNQMQEFVNDAERFASQNPDLMKLKAIILADKASMLLNEDHYDDAIQLYTEALRISEKAKYYARRGDCYYEKSEYEKAMEDYDHALALDPMNPDFLREKSTVLYMQNRLADAQKLIEQSEKFDPNNQNTKENKKLYESNGAQAYSHAQKAYAFLQQEQYGEALKEYNEALRLDGDDYTSYYSRGVCLYYLHRPDEAYADMRQVIARKREYPEAYRLMASIDMDRENYENALEEINYFVKIDPQESEGYYMRALIYWKKGQRNEALDDAQRSCNLGSQKACELHEQIKRKG